MANLMHSSIDRSQQRCRKRRNIDSHPDTADLLRHTAWLSWPLIHWSGRAAPELEAEGPVVRTLHGIIAGKLRSSPAGLYALQPVNALRDDARLLAVTGMRLGAATHALGLAERAERSAARIPQEATIERQQLHARLRMFGQCLRELPAPGSQSAEQRTLRQVSWNVDGLEVQPPLKIRRLLSRHPELTQPGIGEAVMEFALRSSSSKLSSFVEALRVLLVECQLVDEEPARRRGILCSLLKEAILVQPAYLQVVFESSHRGRITKWKPNAAFSKAAVEIFFRDYVPSAAAREFSADARAKFTFGQMCGWIVGADLPPFKKGPLTESPIPPDVMAPLIEALGKIPQATCAPGKIQFVNLAARCAAITGDVDVPRRLAVWLRACRQLCPVKKACDGIWDCAVKSLQEWIAASALDAQNLQQVFALLAARSLELFSFGWIRNATPPAALWSVAKLGQLRREDALAIIDLDQIPVAHEHFSGKPKHLESFLALVTRHHRHWIELTDWDRRYWIRLFSEAHGPALLPQLLCWIEHLLSERAFTFHDATAFTHELVDFLSADEACPERAMREEFLSEHIWLLDRILDEVEISLHALPENGFDHWRSHGSLWTRRFGMFELLYQWETARFSNGALLVNELFAWCRKDDRIAITRRENYPPDHFRNAHENEAMLVRLSGGIPRQLLDLLGYYVERWRKPDDPFDGWLFLDRYPAIQQSLQQLCQRPSRLRGTMRILRRLALALRLQCRAFLHARLEQWMSAFTHREPIETLRAFGQLAGSSDPLPSAGERILAREQQFRRERDTLSKMHAAGRISPSAMKRLAKLDQLLIQPSTIAAWVEKDTRRTVAKLLPLVKVNALSVITREAVRTHWKEVVDRDSAAEGRDWDNALHFYYSATENKAVLRKLLQHTAERNRRWRLQHGPNARFLEELRANGFDAESWLQPYRTAMEVHGETWSVHLEQDPLRVLQMGNLFGTCLSVDDFNAFAAIANAVEINKQVLYLQDSRGAIIGRKLIGLTADGRLFGFRSYGAACLDQLHNPEKPHVWIKIIFDLACLELARRVRGEFDQSPDPEKAADQLRLAAEWYNDGPEAFDWWIARADLAGNINGGSKAPVALAVLQHIHQFGINLSEPSHRALETLRAMLWLGDDAAMIVESLGRGFFAPKCVRFLRCQSPGATVRALLEQGY